MSLEQAWEGTTGHRQEDRIASLVGIFFTSPQGWIGRTETWDALLQAEDASNMPSSPHRLPCLSANQPMLVFHCAQHLNLYPDGQKFRPFARAVEMLPVC